MIRHPAVLKVWQWWRHSFENGVR